MRNSNARMMLHSAPVIHPMLSFGILSKKYFFFIILSWIFFQKQ